MKLEFIKARDLKLGDCVAYSPYPWRKWTCVKKTAKRLHLVDDSGVVLWATPKTFDTDHYVLWQEPAPDCVQPSQEQITRLAHAWLVTVAHPASCLCQPCIVARRLVAPEAVQRQIAFQPRRECNAPEKPADVAAAPKTLHDTSGTRK